MVANFNDMTTSKPSIFMTSMNILRTLAGRIHYCQERDFLTLIHWSLFQQGDGTVNWEPITIMNKDCRQQKNTPVPQNTRYCRCIVKETKHQTTNCLVHIYYNEINPT